MGPSRSEKNSRLLKFHPNPQLPTPQNPDSLGPGFAGQGVVDDFYRRLDVDEFGAVDEKILSPGHAPRAGRNLILGDVGAKRIAIAVAFLIDDLAPALF